jgi:hypothetical protein
MAKSKSGRKTAVLDKLQPSEAAAVLARLLAAHPEFRAEAEQMARSFLNEVSFESVADEVEGVLRQFDLDDLNGRAGGHSWGYTEPSEAAWELLDEALEPFVEDMKRHLGLGLEEEAREICQGIVLGLYRIRDEDGDEFLGWAADFPAEAAQGAVADWISGSKQGAASGHADPKHTAPFREFAEKHVPEWPWISEQLSRGKKK